MQALFQVAIFNNLKRKCEFSVGQNPATQFLNSLNYQLLSQQLAAQMAQVAAATVGQQQQSGGAGPSTLPPGTLPNGILDAQIWEACKVVYSYFSG